MNPVSMVQEMGEHVEMVSDEHGLKGIYWNTGSVRSAVAEREGIPDQPGPDLIHIDLVTKLLRKAGIWVVKMETLGP